MRAGVFLCQCGGNISGVVDLEPLADHLRGLDGVVEVDINQFMCGTEGRAMIEKAVEDRGLDHFVIASCSPRFQGPTFERIARELRLGENAVAFGNIREGCSYVHAHEPETIYVVPIKSDSEHYPPEGKLRVYRSRTGGNEWEALTKGLPQSNCYVNVLREAMAVDSLDRCGVYFGTTGGQVYASADAGDSWTAVVRDLPAVLSVEVQTLP